MIKNYLRQGIGYTIFKYFNFILGFFSQVLLARQLIPNDYTNYLIILSIVEFTTIFFMSSFQASIIKYQDHKNIISNSFILSIIICLFNLFLFYIIYNFTDSMITFEDGKLLFILLAITKSIFIFGFMYSAFLMMEMSFYKLGLIETISSIFSIFIALVLAYLDFKVAALIFRDVAYMFTILLLLFFIVKVKLSFSFDKELIYKLILFMKNSLFLRLSGVSFLRLPNLVFPYFGNPSLSGLYDRSFYFVSLPNTLLNPILGNFSFSLFSKVQNEEDKIKKIIEFKIFLIIRFTMLLYIVVNLFPEIIIYIFGNNWIELKLYIIGMSPLIILLPVLNLFQQLLHSQDRANVIAYLRFFSLFSMLIIFFFTENIIYAFYGLVYSLLLGFVYVFRTTLDGYLLRYYIEILAIIILFKISFYFIWFFYVYDIIFNKNRYNSIIKLVKNIKKG